VRRHLLFVSLFRRFRVEVLSREQLRVLFGRTLAYTVDTKCGSMTETTMLRVSINQNGKPGQLP
jgi:hypothetical protein